MSNQTEEVSVMAWHFSTGRLGHDAEALVVAGGYVYSISDKETPELCVCGMHGSVDPLDALKYAPGTHISRVRIWGDIQAHGDKLVGRHREVLWCADATRKLQEFSLWCARYTPLADGRIVWDLLDDAHKSLVEIAEQGLAGRKNRAAAGAAALAAAGAATRAATRVAALEEARAATRAAAPEAAHAAAKYVAWAAVEAALEAAHAASAARAGDRRTAKYVAWAAVEAALAAARAAQARQLGIMLGALETERGK